MNTRASIVRRDGVAACVLTLATVACLFTWSPSLRPGFSPPRPAPPAITYYDECPDTRARCDRDPALIALSATMMLPPAKRGQANVVTPPLDTASRFLRFPDTPPTERNDQIPMLTPPRPMTHLAPQRLALPVPIPASGVIGTQRPASAPPAYQMELTGNWQGRSVDLAPMFALSEPSGPWSFTAVLHYDETGRVQHALLESAALDLLLRDEVTRRLYQCRITPSGAPGEGRLTVYGPGRASRP
ncbi:MAG: hypothetical protein ABIJ53_04775 [Verrucomicrobiota bacterium]